MDRKVPSFGWNGGGSDDETWGEVFLLGQVKDGITMRVMRSIFPGKVAFMTGFTVHDVACDSIVVSDCVGVRHGPSFDRARRYRGHEEHTRFGCRSSVIGSLWDQLFFIGSHRHKVTSITTCL